MRMTLIFVVLAMLAPITLQHGRMMKPVQRSSMWRKGYNTPANYNDNELFCGGRKKIQELGGLCGVCGDDYTAKTRENEAGGRYATGIIVESYPAGTTSIQTTLEITALHRGYFEFRLCPHNNPKVPVSQECLNEYPLPIAEANRENHTEYYPDKRGLIDLTLYIPREITCSQCVLQWRYRAGNSWGMGEDGKSCLGCGVQEEFRNCADISIGGTGSGIAAPTNDWTTSSPFTGTTAPPKSTGLANQGPIMPLVERTRVSVPTEETTRPSRRWPPGIPSRSNELTRDERDRLVIGGVWRETRPWGGITKNQRDNTKNTNTGTNNRGRNIKSDLLRSRNNQRDRNAGNTRGHVLGNSNRRVTSPTRRNRIAELSRRRQTGISGTRANDNTRRGINRVPTTRRNGSGKIIGVSNPIVKLLQALKVWQERFQNLQRIARRLVIEANNARNHQTVSSRRNAQQAFPVTGSARTHAQQHHSQPMFSETRSLTDMSHAFPFDESMNNAQSLTDLAHSFPLPDEPEVHNVNDMAHSYPLQDEPTTSSPNSILGSITPRDLDHEIKNSLYMTSKIQNLINMFSLRNRAREILDVSRSDAFGHTHHRHTYHGHTHHTHNDIAYDYPTEHAGTTVSSVQNNNQAQHMAFDFPMSDMPQEHDTSTHKPEMGFKKRAPEVVQEKVKIYINKYNRINPGSLDHAAAKNSKKTHWFDKLLKKNNATSLGKGNVQLSDKTVLKVPGGAVFDQNALKK